MAIDVRIYTTNYCGYCTAAKSLLRERGVGVPADFDALTALTDFGVAFRYEAYDEPDEPFDRAQIIQQVEKLLHHVTNLLPSEEKS